MTIAPDLAGPTQAPVAGKPLADLLDHWSRSALSLARRIVLDGGLAEDVVQDAFLAYWCKPAAFDPARGSFGPWLLSMVHHKSVDAVRREQSHRRRAESAAARAAVQPDSLPDVADVVLGRIACAELQAALLELPEEQREAIVLAYWGGLSQREIALRTGTPLGTVKTRTLAGMRRLQKCLLAGGPAAGMPTAVAAALS